MNTTDIEYLARGYWGRHFRYKLYPKHIVLAVAALVLFAVSVMGLIASNINASHPDAVTSVTIVNPGEITISQPYSGGLVIQQDGKQLPTLVSDTTNNQTNNGNTLIGLISAIVLLAGAILFLVWLCLYTDAREDFVKDSVQRWVSSSENEVPTALSVQSFLDRR
jgi:flagellar basal body-associated protein FliL